MNKLLILITCFLISSCNGTYIKKVCNESNAINEASFEGKFLVEYGFSKSIWTVTKIKSKKGFYEVIVPDYAGKLDRFKIQLCQIEEHLIAEYEQQEGIKGVSKGKLTHSFIFKDNKGGFEYFPLKLFKDKESNLIIFDNKKIESSAFVKFTFENQRAVSPTTLKLIK